MPFKKEAANAPRFCLIDPEDGGPPIRSLLPPIEQVVLPVATTKTLVIRWLDKLGYTVVEIHQYLGVKYQMVRNITTTVPKRAAREDMPPLVVRYKPPTDEIQDVLDGLLEESLLAGRKERQQSNRAEEGTEEVS